MFYLGFPDHGLECSTQWSYPDFPSGKIGKILEKLELENEDLPGSTRQQLVVEGVTNSLVNWVQWMSESPQYQSHSPSLGKGQEDQKPYTENLSPKEGLGNPFLDA